MNWVALPHSRGARRQIDIRLAASFAYRNLLQLTTTGIEGDLGWSRSLLSSGATLALVAMAAGNLFGGTLWTVTGVALSVGIRREPAPQGV